jgi:hypothetical protein
MAPRVERKLAAILAADVVGSRAQPPAICGIR